MPSNFFQKVSILAAVFGFALLLTFPAQADTTAELQSKIEAGNAQLTALEEEIAAYEAELTKVGADRKTLESEITRLDLTRKKLATDIAVTQNRIATTGLQLEELEEEITDKERRITESTGAIEQSLRLVHRLDDSTFVEHFLAGASFSDAWTEADQLRRVQTALGNEVAKLSAVQNALREDFAAAAKKQGQLVSFQKELSGQKTVLDQNRSQRSSVLSQTKSKESEYQALLREKQEARELLEAELRDFEAELQYTLDPSKIPAAGSGVLSFPLDTNFIQRCGGREKTYGNLYCITQFFGNTAFAQSGAYNGKGHNGIDFGAPTGTKVLAALSGIVEATGNTDAIRGCYSFGKWVLVRHSNGLATLYAHLSHIGVSRGEAVATGGFLGYSGVTGFATGPHLHFTVYVADQVRLVRLGDIKSKTNCAAAVVPVAPTEAYLNPISYL